MWGFWLGTVNLVVRRIEHQNLERAIGMSGASSTTIDTSSLLDPATPASHQATTRSTFGDTEPPLLLSLAPVLPDDVVARVCKTRKWIMQVIATYIICFGVHVLAGWLIATHFGKSPMHEAGDACLVTSKYKPENGVALINEIPFDTFITAFLTSGGQLPQRIRDVQKGRLPRVSAAAFPRGRLLSFLFPKCQCGDASPPTRKDHGRNLLSLFGLAGACTVFWCAITFFGLFVMWCSPLIGGGEHTLCMSAWVYIFLRAAWTSVGAAACTGCAYILWCTRGERPPPGGLAPLPVAMPRTPLADPTPMRED